MPDPINIGGLEVVSMNLVNQWGLSPASGSIEAVGDEPPVEGDELLLTLGGFSFYGLVTDVVRMVDQGKKWSITVTDMREKLKDDTVYGFLNRVEWIEDDPTTPGIDRKKRFAHLLPENWDSYTITYTDAPYTAAQMLDLLKDAPTVRYTWQIDPHDNLDQKPLAIDFETGKELGVVVQEIIEECGLVMGIDGEDTLRFAVLGEGDVPPFPSDSRQRQFGMALSTAPTKVRVVGDRNQYQVLNLSLNPDWKSGWQQWWGELQWLGKVEEWFGPFAETKSGRAELAAKARTVTVRDVVTASGDDTLADRGLWGEVSRMEIPAWIYLQDVVFKAYRVPNDFSVGETPLRSLELKEGLIVPVIYDGETGVHTRDPGEDEYLPDTKAFITVKGQPLDVWDPSRSGEFDPNVLENARSRWQSNARFNLDTRNFTVLFEEATFADAKDDGALIVFPNQHLNDIDDQLRYVGVPNANAQISATEVKATFVFAAERYHYDQGNGRRQDTVHQPGLLKHVVGDEEILYVDGEDADTKAEEIADLLLDREQQVLSGGYSRIGSAGTTLTGGMSQVVVNLSFGQGLTEQVRFSNERGLRNWDSDRELERRRKSKELFPGQKRAKEEVVLLEQTAKNYKAAQRPQHRHYTGIGDVAMKPVTNREANPKLDHRVDTAPVLKAGDCQFVDEDGNLGAEGDEFAGVVIPSEVTGSQVPLARQGLVPVRVQGPFNAGDGVGCDQDETVASSGGERNVGEVTRNYEGTDIVVVPVRLGAGSTRSRMEWELRPAGEGKVKMFGGTVTGFGESNFVPPGLTQNDWAEFEIGGSTVFYLKIEFTPTVEQNHYYTDPPNDTVLVKHVVGGGYAGTPSPDVTLEWGASLPDDEAPEVDVDTGAVDQVGIYHIPIADAQAVGDRFVTNNRLIGPLAAKFCGPAAMVVHELKITEQT